MSRQGPTYAIENKLWQMVDEMECTDCGSIIGNYNYGDDHMDIRWNPFVVHLNTSPGSIDRYDFLCVDCHEEAG